MLRRAPCRRLLTDEKFHAAYMEELLPRLNAMRVRPFTERVLHPSEPRAAPCA